MRKLAFLVTIFLCCTFTALRAQEPVTVQGVVKDVNGQPMAGVSVKEVSTKTGVATDEKGHYTIHLQSASSQIEVSFVGFTKQKINVKGKTEINVVLSEDEGKKSLTDIVVVGVQRQSKRTTTAAVSSISGKEIENIPAASPDALLQGRIPGLNVQVISGEPGTAPTMVVRGNSRVNQSIGNIDQAHALSGPLYVIDGVPVNPEDIGNNIDATGTNFLAGINVNDIESIDVQKDAAATAAWGSRGANGVIYIRTRRGRSSRPEFHVNGYAGITQQPKLLPTVTGAEERQQKLNLLKTYGNWAQLQNIPQLLTDSLNPYFNNATDWQGMFYRNGNIQNYDVSMAAANDILNYRLSMNYYNEQGVIEAFGFKRYSMRGNFDFKISPKLNSQFVFGLSRNDRQRGRKYNNSDENTPVSSYSIPASFFKLTGFDSLNYSGMYDKLRNENVNNLYSGAMTINYDIIKGLRFTTQGSASVSTSDRDYFQPSNIDAVQAAIGNAQRSYAEADRGNYTNYFISNTLNYNKTFSTASHDHNIVVTASQQFNRDVFKTSMSSAYDIPSNDIEVVSGAPQGSLGASSSYGASSILSFMGQVQYDFDKKYLLYGGMRGDASSRFGANSKWGYFPSMGAGWVISDEKFMRGTKGFLNFLKLRASYGQSGSQSQDYYAPFNSYNVAGTYGGQSVIQPSYTNGLTKDNLTWAKAKQTDIGIETQWLNNRISATFDFYDRLSTNDYFNFNLPFYTGYQSIKFNANDLWVDNRGVELTLTTHNIAPGKKWQWTTQVNIAYNKNAIAKLPNDNRTFIVDDYYGITRIYAVGQPIYQMFQMKYAGVYNKTSEIPFNPLTGNPNTYFKGNYPIKPGYPIWRDINGDHDVWSDEDNGDAFGDRVPTGDPNPKITGGFVNTITYGNFNLNVICVYAFKRDIINYFEQNQIASAFNFGDGLKTFASTRLPSLDGLNYWVPQGAAKDPNYHADFPALNPYGANFYQFLPFSTMFNEKGDYFKVKTVSLSYALPNKWINAIKLHGARVYGMMDNVLIIKSSSVPDPELVNELGVYTGGAFPIPKKYTFGLDITF